MAGSLTQGSSQGEDERKVLLQTRRASSVAVAQLADSRHADVEDPLSAKDFFTNALFCC
jgi:hypothetical protein